MVFIEYLGIAFVSACGLLILSKIIMQKLLRRNSQYYDSKEK